MNMFEIATFLPVKGKSINIREENHGDEKVKCVDWYVIVEQTNDWLDKLDPELKPMFYRAVESDDDLERPELDGVQAAMPVLRSHRVKFPFALEVELAGYQLTVDRGLGGKSNITLLEVGLSKFTITCMEGGSVRVTFRIQAKNVPTEVRGQLSDYIKGATCAIALKPPQERQEAIDGTKGHPGAVGAAAADAAKKNAPAPTGHEAGDKLVENEAAGLNKPASEVPKAKGKRGKGTVNKPSLKAPVEEADVTY